MSHNFVRHGQKIVVTYKNIQIKKVYIIEIIKITVFPTCKMSFNISIINNNDYDDDNNNNNNNNNINNNSNIIIIQGGQQN